MRTDSPAPPTPQDEPSAYVREAECDFVVDLELEGGAPHRSTTATWHVWARRRFLDASRSPSWSRAFYVPKLSEQRNAYADYVLLGRRGRPAMASD